MRETYAGPYVYTLQGVGCVQWHLHIYEGRGALPVVVATLPAAADGVMGTAQDLAGMASAVWRDLLAHAPEGLRWVMRAPSGALDRPLHDCFAEVTFAIGERRQLTNPSWRRLTRADIAALCAGDGRS